MIPLLAHGGATGWEWHAHFDVWAVMVGLALFYVFALESWGRGEPPPTRWQKISFFTGLAALWIVSDYPVHDIAENYLLSVHMAQHLTMTLVVPPLLIAGCPTWLLERLLVAPRAVYPIVRQLARPLPATLIFNAATVFTHWPVIVNAALDYHALHFFLHVLLISTGLLMWLPVVHRSDKLPRVSGLFAMVYLFLQSVIPTVPASFITFAEAPVYRFYAEAPRPFSLSVIDDQQIAGAMMKVGGGAILWTVIIITFFRWYESEQRHGRASSPAARSSV